MRHRQVERGMSESTKPPNSKYRCMLNYNSDHDLSYKDINKPSTQSNINEHTLSNSMTILYRYLLSY